MEVSPAVLLKNYALNLIYGKLDKYKTENSHFENKHSCSFAEFSCKIEAMEEQEEFELEDDFMDWKFASENLAYWQKMLDEIISE